MTTTPDTDLPLRRKLGWRAVVETYGPLAALLLLLAFTACWELATTGNTVVLKPQNLVNIFRQNAAVCVVAIGMTLVIISGGIDLSVGSLVALSGGLAVWLMNASILAPQWIAANARAVKDHQELLAMGVQTSLDLQHTGAKMVAAEFFTRLGLAGQEGWGVAIAFVAALVVASVGGWLAGVLTSKGRIAPFIATLGLLAIYRSLATYPVDASTYDSASKTLFPVIGAKGFSWEIGGYAIPLGRLDSGIPLAVPWSLLVVVGMAILAAYLLNRTRFGRYVIAIGSNERAAVYSAIRVDRVKIWVYTFMGFCCGVSAILFASRQNSLNSASAGNLFELDAIAAVVIGGTRLNGGSGRITGTIIGVLLLGLISNMLVLLGVSVHLQGAVKGGIIIAAALLQQVGRKN